MRQGEWSRPINGLVFVKEKIKWMEEHNIDHAVMLCLSQLYCNGWDKQDCIDAINFQNDFNASIQKEFTKKFSCGFVVQPLFIDEALKEIEGALMNLIKNTLFAYIYNKQGQWLSVADKEVDPIFELANKYSLALQIHHDGDKMIALKDQYWRFHLVWMMAQCADTLHLFTLRDLPTNIQNRTSFAHGAMLGIANYGRRIQGFDGRPDILKLRTPEKL